MCTAINNIEYVGLEMSPICDKLNTQKILDELTKIKGDQIGSQCRRTVETVMQDATENINNKIFEILENIGYKVKGLVYECTSYFYNSALTFLEI